MSSYYEQVLEMYSLGLFPTLSAVQFECAAQKELKEMKTETVTENRQRRERATGKREREREGRKKDV